MYLSKTKKRIIIIFVGVLLVAVGVTAFLLLQKPKVETAQIQGSGYTGSDLVASVTPMDATVTYQWKVSTTQSGNYVDVPGGTTNTITLGLQDEGKFYKVSILGKDEYTGTVESLAFGPIKGVSIIWPSSSPITYGQPLSASKISEGSALINGINVSGRFAFEKPESIPSIAGIYKAKIIFTPTDLNAYKTISSTIDVSVNKAILIVTIENMSVTYGDFLNDFKYSITGFLLSDDVSVVKGSPYFTSVYSVGTSVTYNPIQLIGEVGSLTSDNYDFSFVFGQLIINKRTLTISGLSGNDKTYDGTTKATASGKAKLVGIFLAEDVSLGGSGRYAFVNKNVGNNIRINCTGFTLRGTKAINYTLVQPSLYADIKAVVNP